MHADAACRHGTQGIHDTASKGTLEDEFGTSNEDDVMQQILEKGTVIETEVSTDEASGIFYRFSLTNHAEPRTYWREEHHTGWFGGSLKHRVSACTEWLRDMSRHSMEKRDMAEQRVPRACV